jgi:hypothetical protein
MKVLMIAVTMAAEAAAKTGRSLHGSSLGYAVVSKAVRTKVLMSTWLFECWHSIDS